MRVKLRQSRPPSARQMHLAAWRHDRCARDGGVAASCWLHSRALPSAAAPGHRVARAARTLLRAPSLSQVAAAAARTNLPSPAPAHVPSPNLARRRLPKPATRSGAVAVLIPVRGRPCLQLQRISHPRPKPSCLLGHASSQVRFGLSVCLAQQTLPAWLMTPGAPAMQR